MEDYDSILERSRLLSPEDRLRLAQTLFEEASTERTSDEIGTGTRGLSAWTESTRDEDWSDFYPATLRQKRVG